MSIKPSKVGIVGAGNVGAAIVNALVLLGKSVSIVLFDRNLSKAEGQAWDISDAIPLLAQMDVIPSNRYDDLADSDIIAITIGAPHRPGQTRLDLLCALQ
ncbi:MAG: NAD(P)-binding domain-containing protein [Tolypothrix carrinoi HA7290-LM1]|jgi:L-lactate dehydrogenase|nr:NAD(P)-binding domain-containing protein [Tolypothrix carrinoi HA7290-LM1]